MSRPRWEPALAIGLTVIVVALVIGRALVADHDWLPTTDWALIELRVRDIGGSFPLLGAPSAARFHHPGPLAYLALAPVYRLAGSTPWALGLSTAVVSAAAIAGTAWTAWRRGRLVLVLLTLAVLVWLLGSLPTAFTRDPWNPWMAILPCFWLVLLVWSVLEDDLVALPLVAFVGSFVLQAHIGYLFLVGAAFATVAGTAAIRTVRATRGGPAPGPATGIDREVDESRREPSGRTRLAWVVAAVAVLAVVWAPPIIEQLTTSPGNLTLGRQAFASSSQGPRLSTGATLDVLAAELGAIPPWASGVEPVDSIANKVIPGSAGALAVPLGVLAAALALAWPDRAARRFVVVAAAADAIGVFTASRLEADRVFPYVVRFLWPLGAVTLLAALWALATRVLAAAPAGMTSTTGAEPGPTIGRATVALGADGPSEAGTAIGGTGAPLTATRVADRPGGGRDEEQRARVASGPWWWAVVGVAAVLLAGSLVRDAGRDDTTLPIYQTMNHEQEAACIAALLPALQADVAATAGGGPATVHLRFEEGDWPIVNAAIANELDRRGTTVAVDEPFSFFIDRPGRDPQPGDIPYVIAVNGDVDEIGARPGATPVASCDQLSPADRAAITDARVNGTPIEPLRALDLALRDLRVTIYRLPAA